MQAFGTSPVTDPTAAASLLQLLAVVADPKAAQANIAALKKETENSQKAAQEAARLRTDVDEKLVNLGMREAALDQGMRDLAAQKANLKGLTEELLQRKSRLADAEAQLARDKAAWDATVKRVATDLEMREAGVKRREADVTIAEQRARDAEASANRRVANLEKALRG